MLATKLSKEEQLTEEDLLKNLAHGDYKAFTQLYETYVAPVTNYAYRFTDDIQIIEDSLHDIFVWLWNNRAQLQVTHSIKAYLFKSVRTSVLRKVQKDKKVIFLQESGEKNALPFFVSHEEKYINEENRSILTGKMAKVLNLLTSKQKEVIYLRFYQGLSFDEVATNMNLSTKACYKLMGRAMFELRKTCRQSWESCVIIFSAFSYFMG